MSSSPSPFFLKILKTFHAVRLMPLRLPLKFSKPCVNFDKGNTVPFVESFSTKYKAKDGKGKSNSYKDGEGDLKNEIESISKKVKIDDIFYVGHSGTGYVFFEYGSHTKINDAWQIDPASGRRSGQASSLRPDFYDPLTMAKKVDFNQGSGPRLYHLGCFGATGSGATQSFRNAAITNWGVKVRSCLGRTNYAKDKTEVFLIPCDDKNVNIIIPEASDLKAGYTW